MLQPLLTKNKPPPFELRRHCRSISCNVEILVVAFIPNPENKRMLEHIDDVITNNHVKKLRWPSDFK